MQDRLAALFVLVATLAVGCKSQPTTVTPGKNDSAASLAFGGLPSGAVVAGVPVVATLGPRNADGDAVVGFEGHVAFTSSDANAVLPSGYSFTSDDAGAKSVSITFKSAGTQTVKATSAGLTTGDVSVTVIAADAASLAAQGPNTVVSDANFSVTLDAHDAYGNVATGYRGTLHFTSTDPNATLPANYTFTPLDAGHAVVSGFTLGRVSSATTITAVDVSAASLTAITASAHVTPGLAKSLDLTLNSNAWLAGAANTVMVTARDKYGAVATGFRGTVTVSLQNPNTPLAPYAFTEADAGQHAFSNVSVCSLGNHTLQVVCSGLMPPAPQTVTASTGPLGNLVMNSNDLDPAVPGQARHFVVTKTDSCGNATAGDAGTVHFTSNVANLAGNSVEPTLPADQSFGVNTAQLAVVATWPDAGDYQLVAASTTVDGVTGRARVGVHAIDALSINGTDSASFSCALLDGSWVKCWGVDVADNGPSGNLGLGDLQPRGATGTMGAQLPPVDLGGGVSVSSVSAGGFHACAVTGDHRIKCWGNNEYGELGTGDASSHGDGQAGHEMGADLPYVALPTGRTATEVSAAAWHTCAVVDDGSVICWGYNHDGELGIGDANNRGYSPATSGDNLVAIDFGGGSTVVHLSSQQRVTCAILSDGSVKCWGRNDDGELGYNGTTNVGDSLATGHTVAGAAALPLGTGRTATALASGSFHTCALLDDGSVKCWGYGGSGQLGQDSTNTINDLSDSLPAIVLGQSATAIAAMEQSSCAILQDGSVKCWGKNNAGQLGQGNGTYYGSSAASDKSMSALTAVNLGAGRTAVKLAAGSNHVCAVLDNGRLRCWGYNGDAKIELGNGAAPNVGTDPGQMGDALRPTPLW